MSEILPPNAMLYQTFTLSYVLPPQFRLFFLLQRMLFLHVGSQPTSREGPAVEGIACSDLPCPLG